jgi:hypothetical protein
MNFVGGSNIKFQAQSHFDLQFDFISVKRRFHETLFAVDGDRVHFCRGMGAKGRCGAGGGWSIHIRYPADVYAYSGPERCLDVQV